MDLMITLMLGILAPAIVASAMTKDRNITDCTPPSLHGVEYCEHDNHVCTTAKVKASVDQAVTISANYSGTEPFNVQWYHNETEFVCEKYHCREEEHSGISSIWIDRPHSAKFSGDPGYYQANVSNACGWNISATWFEIDCYAPPPSPITQDTTRTVTLGSNVSLSCAIYINEKSYLSVCYAKPNQKFTDLNTTRDCVQCYPNTNGPCSYTFPMIESRPDWNVTRIPSTASCNFSIETTVHISTVSQADEGKMICLYGDDVKPWNQYTVMELTVEEKSSNPLSMRLEFYIIAPTAGVIILILVVALVVVGVIKLKKKGRHHRRRYRRARGTMIPQPPRKSWLCPYDPERTPINVKGRGPVQRNYDSTAKSSAPESSAPESSGPETFSGVLSGSEARIV